MSNISVNGLSELQAFLNQLPAKMEQNVMRGALRAGAAPILAAAKQLCPVGPPSAEGVRLYGHYQGALRDSIRMSVKAKKGRVTASVKAGGKTKRGADVWYAHLIEFTGAAPHVITAKKGGALGFAGGLYKKVNHPGMRAQPFLRPALDQQSQAAVQAAGEYIKKRLAEKHGLDTADIQIGGGK